MPKRTRPAGRQPDAHKRRRAYVACTECRRRKRKCNGTEPCSSCDEYGYACTYGPGVGFNHGGDADIDAAAIYRAQTVAKDTTNRSRLGSAAQSSPQVTSSSLIVHKERSRFVSAHSAVALPHVVGRELDAERLPRLHSFAWNLGLRPVRRGEIATALSSFVTLEDCCRLSSVYFSAVHPLFAFLSEDAYWKRLHQHWGALEDQPDFAAIVAGVAALGSFFSHPSHPQEDKMKSHCVSILDLALSTPAVPGNIEAVAGWILRTLYLRLTSRPAVACLASHMAMHMVEITSLHREVSNIATSSLGQKVQFTQEEVDTRRRYYWVARALDSVLSVEYGIAPVKLANATCAPPASGSDPDMEHLVSLGEILNSAENAAQDDIGHQNMGDQFSRLSRIPSNSAVVSIFKADVCLCMLRRLFSVALRPDQEIVTACVTTLQSALESIPELLVARHPWWNIVSVPFQMVCVCLFLDTQPFLTLLPNAMDVLRTVAECFDTHMAQEALNTAQQLVAASKDQTASKLALKSTALGDAEQNTSIDWLPLGNEFDLMDSWPLGIDF